MNNKDNKKYKVGGYITVSDKNYEIKEIAAFDGKFIFKVIHDSTYSWIEESLIQNYYDAVDVNWIVGEGNKAYPDCFKISGKPFLQSEIRSFENYLRDKYGVPPVLRKFNGEDSGLFGINDNSFIFVKSERWGWVLRRYHSLELRDLWIYINAIDKYKTSEDLME